MEQRNAMLDITKYVFAVVILFLHANPFVDGHKIFAMNKGYLAVEFFFVVSGYFMMQSAFGKNGGGG